MLRELILWAEAQIWTFTRLSPEASSCCKRAFVCGTVPVHTGLMLIVIRYSEVCKSQMVSGTSALDLGGAKEVETGLNLIDTRILEICKRPI